jgi:hypothetical protein
MQRWAWPGRNARINHFQRATHISHGTDGKTNVLLHEQGRGWRWRELWRATVKTEGGWEGFLHLPHAHPLFLTSPPLPPFQAPPPVGKQVSNTHISGRRWLRRLHLGFIFFLVEHLFTFGDDCKESLTLVARLWLDLGYELSDLPRV